MSSSYLVLLRVVFGDKPLCIGILITLYLDLGKCFLINLELELDNIT
jgi:hypothetical protein